MMIIKWHRDKTEELPLYELYAYIGDKHKTTIGYLGWNSFTQCWILNYYIPCIQETKSKKYDNYTIEEINDVLFRAILDIQKDLSFINNMCVDYCNAISDYIIDYVQGIDHNED